MPTLLEPKLKDRFYDFLFGTPSGRDLALLAAARPPLWVRMVFDLIYAGLMAALLLAIYLVTAAWLTNVFGISIPLSGNLPDWPVSLLVVPLCLAAQFARQQVYRHYGRRALREQQDHE